MTFCLLFGQNEGRERTRDPDRLTDSQSDEIESGIDQRALIFQI